MRTQKKIEEIREEASTAKKKFKALDYEAKIAMNAKVELLEELELLSTLKKIV